jgi:hypothetical protein
MPFIVNNDDFVLFKKDIDNLCDLISKVLKMEEFPNFRERIISEFPLSRRRNELLSEINELIN